MVLMSIEQYSTLTMDVEEKLDEADTLARSSTARLSKAEVFKAARSYIDEQTKL